MKQYVYVFVLGLILMSHTKIAHSDDIQLWDGMVALYQKGRLVGQVYTPKRATSARTYKEYWYVAEEYVYPGKTNSAELHIKPLSSSIRSLKEFRHIMKDKFPNGKMIIASVSEEK